jgi:hypothetical protein
LGYGYKGLVLINGKHGQGIKMGADKLAENTPNAQKLVCPSPKVWDFDEKRLHWASWEKVKLIIARNWSVMRIMLQTTNPVPVIIPIYVGT